MNSTWMNVEGFLLLGNHLLDHVERDPSSISGYILSALFFKLHKLLKDLQNSLTPQKT